MVTIKITYSNNRIYHYLLELHVSRTQTNALRKIAQEELKKQRNLRLISAEV